MAFDLKAFEKAKYQPRTAKVTVPGLAHFFDKDEEPEWVVRSLEGSEVALVREEVALNRAAIGPGGDTIRAIQVLVGQTPDTVPDQLVHDMVTVRIGSVSPEIDHQTAKKLAKNHPIEFMEIAKEVWRMTGLGAATEEKLNPSGENQE